MCKWLILLIAMSSIGAGTAAGVTISGNVSAAGSPLRNVEMLAPKATCTTTDALGNYACNVSSGWNGALAPYADGWTFVVAGDVQKAAAVTFANLAANTSGINFVATPAAGLRSELALFRASSGQFFIDYDWNSQPNAIVGFGAPNDVRLVGDVNGDGITDLVVFRNGVWFADTTQDGNADQIFGFGGVPGDKALLGDVDGDGTADLIIFRSGTWFVSTQRNSNANLVYHFGQAGDIPLVGDFNGDGVLDLALYRAGIWYIDTNRDGVPDMVLGFGGVAGEIPLVLDWDGDGRADIAVFRNGLWYINTAQGTGAATVVGYGGAGDLPIAGFFNRANTRFVKAGSACRHRLHAGESLRLDHGRVAGRGRRRHPAHRQGNVRRKPGIQLSRQPVPAGEVRQEQREARRRRQGRGDRVAAFGRCVVPARRLGVFRAGDDDPLAGGGRARDRAGRRPQLRAADVSRPADQRRGVRRDGEPPAECAPHGRVERVAPLRSGEPQSRRAWLVGVGQHLCALSGRRDQPERLHAWRPDHRSRMPAWDSTSAKIPRAMRGAACCTRI